MNYEVDKNEMCIKERDTDHIVVKSKNLDTLKSISRHLNLGGGFDGWTPNFFTKPHILEVK